MIPGIELELKDMQVFPFLEILVIFKNLMIGNESFWIHTWKPVESRINELSNYFLGGSSSILDLSFLHDVICYFSNM